MSDLDPYRQAPEGKQFNGFSGELEDAAPLSLNPDPAEQRILSNNGVDKPLTELNDLYNKGLINLDGTPIEENPAEEVTEEVPAQEESNDVSVQTSGDAGDTEDAAESAEQV